MDFRIGLFLIIPSSLLIVGSFIVCVAGGSGADHYRHHHHPSHLHHVPVNEGPARSEKLDSPSSLLFRE
jgi:hypothetical protein